MVIHADNIIYDNNRTEKEEQERCFRFFQKAEQKMEEHLGCNKKYKIECDGWFMTVSETVSKKDEVAKLDLRLTSQWKYDKQLGGITFRYGNKEMILWFDRVDYFVKDENVHFLGLHEWEKKNKAE